MSEMDMLGARAPEGSAGPDESLPPAAAPADGPDALPAADTAVAQGKPAPDASASGKPAPDAVGSGISASAPGTGPAGTVPDGPAGFGDLARHFRRLRLMERSLGVALVAFLFMYHDWFLALGALLGALVLDVNLLVFQRVIDRAVPGRQDRPVWVTILKFYGLFALTVAASFLIVWLRAGDPLGFLGGIMILLPAMLLTVLWSGVEFLLSVRRVTGNA